MLTLRRAVTRGLLAIVAMALGAGLSSAYAQTSGSGLGQVIQNVLNQPGGLQQVLQGTPIPGNGSPTNPTITVQPGTTAQTTTIPVAGQTGTTTGTGMPSNGLPAQGTMPPATPSGPPQTHLEKIMSDRAGVPLSL